MFGLLYFGAGLVYLLLSLGLALLVSRLARRFGGTGWKWGLVVFAGMMLVVFWDWLPMEVRFHYLCSSRGGFVQYQTLEQWKKAHPGVARTLVPYDLRRPEVATLPPRRYLVGSEKVAQGRWGDTRRIERYRYPSGMEVVVRYEVDRAGETPSAGRIDRVEVLGPGLKAGEAAYLNRRFAWVHRSIPHWFHIVEREEWIVDLETGEVLARYVDFGTRWFRISSCEMAGHNVAKRRFNEFSHLVKYREEIRL